MKKTMAQKNKNKYQQGMKKMWKFPSIHQSMEVEIESLGQYEAIVQRDIILQDN
ncbi:hypothetical protein [Dubosiella muris]|uniref:hypothetical protein n=1 Tax=Dubosiella muris TaxID=3038133 RepID=UPI00144152B0|nr:hypothetical protein [Dubosiella muris]